MKLSAIILTMTTSQEMFKMTSNCINSLSASERGIDIEIIVIESNKEYLNSGFRYPEFIKVVVPELDFNFHGFLNIGIKVSTGDYVALCNNDLIFHEFWFSEILKVKKQNPSIKSFSPSGRIDDFSFINAFELGYKVRTHVMGWCIVADREVFSKIGFLDETFDFCYADNDYAMTLKKYDIKHALVNASKVEHLDKEKRRKKIKGVDKLYEILQSKVDVNLTNLPQYLYTDEYKWLLKDKKGLLDHIKFHNKWGTPNLLYKKNRVADILIQYNLGYFNRLVFFMFDRAVVNLKNKIK